MSPQRTLLSSCSSCVPLYLHAAVHRLPSSISPDYLLSWIGGKSLCRLKVMKACSTASFYQADNHPTFHKLSLHTTIIAIPHVLMCIHTAVACSVAWLCVQVRSKADTVTSLFNQLPAVQRAYAYLQLAKRFLLQCETQVQPGITRK